MTLVEKPCVCVCVCVPHAGWVKRNQAECRPGLWQAPHLGQAGPVSGAGSLDPTTPHPRPESRAVTSTSVAWRCRVGSRVTASPFWGVWAPSSYSRGQVGGGTLARLGQGYRGSSGPHVWTWDSGPGSFLQEIVSPENQKPSEQLSMKSNVDFFLML